MAELPLCAPRTVRHELTTSVAPPRPVLGNGEPPIGLGPALGAAHGHSPRALASDRSAKHVATLAVIMGELPGPSGCRSRQSHHSTEQMFYYRVSLTRAPWGETPTSARVRNLISTRPHACGHRAASRDACGESDPYAWVVSRRVGGCRGSPARPPNRQGFRNNPDEEYSRRGNCGVAQRSSSR
jgi:hypothetical protein